MIIEMMNRIADFIEEAVEALVEFAVILFWLAVFAALIVTCPIWIIPFLIGRRIHEMWVDISKKEKCNYEQRQTENPG